MLVAFRFGAFYFLTEIDFSATFQGLAKFSEPFDQACVWKRSLRPAEYPASARDRVYLDASTKAGCVAINYSMHGTGVRSPRCERVIRV